MEYRIGIDIGGTTIKAGVVNHRNKLIHSCFIPTLARREAEEILADISRLIDRLLEECNISLSEVISVGIGVPGTANQMTGILEYANNINLNQVCMTEYLKKKLGKPVYFDNDANAAAWAEYLLGVGKKTESLMMVTLGTGVGGGMIMDHSIWRGCNYAAAEIGHMVLQKDGRPCNCGRKGCFEAYASVSALIQMTKEKMETSSGSLLWEICNHDTSQLNGEMIIEGVKQQDSLALFMWEMYLEYLSEGIANLINIFQPNLLCLGGGISQVGDLLLLPLQEKVNSMIYTRDSEKKTKIEVALLGNDAGILGAALLGKQKRQRGGVANGGACV